MAKTKALKKVVKQRIASAGSVAAFYQQADKTAETPYAVFNFRSTSLGDFNRDDVNIEIDIWGKEGDTTDIETVADAIEAAFNNYNAPTSDILPTFFRESRNEIIDSDKKMRRIEIVISCQNYDI